MVDVHMHRPTTNSKHFVDALGAFLPGLQVNFFSYPSIYKSRLYLLILLSNLTKRKLENISFGRD